MQTDQTVADMAVDVLARRAGARAKQTGETFEEALKAVTETGAGQRLKELRDGPHREESAEQWQEDLARKRERARERAEERRRAQQAAWKRFIQTELRELEHRKNGQLARLLAEALPGEPPEELERLAFEDQRQAEEGVVALMSGGKMHYKRLDELCPEDLPARVAANRLRTAWLKERVDEWRGYG